MLVLGSYSTYKATRLPHEENLLVVQPIRRKCLIHSPLFSAAIRLRGMALRAMDDLQTPVQLESTQAGVALAPQPWTTTTLVGPCLASATTNGWRKQTCSAGKTTREGEVIGLGRRDRDGSLRRDRGVVEKLF